MRESIFLFKRIQKSLREQFTETDKLPLNGITALMGFLTITKFSLTEDKVTASMGRVETEMDIELLDDEIINEIIEQMKFFL